MFNKIFGSLIKPDSCYTPPSKNILEKRHIDLAQKENNPTLILELLGHADQMVNKSGERAIHLAAKYNYLDLAKALADKKADLDARDKSYKTPLHTCAMNDSFEVAKFLLSKGVSVSSKTNGGENILHKCSQKNSIRIAELIYEKERYLINMQDKDSSTPLHTAVRNGSAEMVEFLLDHGADMDSKEAGAPPLLFLKLSNNSIRIAKAFQSKGYNILKKMGGFSLFNSAIMDGNIEFAQFMLDSGAGINSKIDGETPIFIAVTMAQNNADIMLPMIIFLMDNGANPKLKSGGEYIDCGTALELASNIEDKELSNKILAILNKNS